MIGWIMPLYPHDTLQIDMWAGQDRARSKGGGGMVIFVSDKPCEIVWMAFGSLIKVTMIPLLRDIPLIPTFFIAMVLLLR